MTEELICDISTEILNVTRIATDEDINQYILTMIRPFEEEFTTMANKHPTTYLIG